MAVWSLPPTIRAQILNGDLVLASFVDLNALQGHLAALDISAEFAKDGWLFRRGEAELAFSAAAAYRAGLDVAFGGLNLQSLASRIAERLALEAEST